MNIALLGYGKMGKVIEQLALERGHSITHIITESDQLSGLTDADVAIDFSIPDAAFANLSHCILNGIPVVSGTTGWLDRYQDISDLCLEKGGAFIYASNFSLGVNIFFEINERLAELMSNQSQYKIAIEEIHHTQKLDAPSGTAITLAEGIMRNSKMEGWELNQSDEKTIPITAKRIKGVPGTHRIDYTSAIDTISISHTAHNRKGFALGAVVAAEWLASGKKGVFSMKDVLNIG